MGDYVKDFEIFYLANKGKKNYILGFSYGAVITFILANVLKPKKIFLCSLSPDFKEDLESMKPWIIKYIGKKRFKDAKTRSAIKIAKELSVPSVLFYGEKEGKAYPKLKKRAEETVKLARNSKLVVVPKAPHDISFSEYKITIMREFSSHFVH
jgi:pimeloyl-ACP methyl ester carboxylesterase